MATELNHLSSVNGSPVQLSDKSGQMAAPLLSDGAVKNDAQAEQEAKQLAQETRPNQNELAKQVQNLQDFSQLQGWTVNFSVEQTLDQVVIKVVDAETGSMIRQIPSEEMIAINKRIKALQQGDTGINPRVGLLLDSEI